MSDNSGAICGGVVKQSEFDKDPWAYMMAYYMADDKFDEYQKLVESGDTKAASKFADKYARSAV